MQLTQLQAVVMRGKRRKTRGEYVIGIFMLVIVNIVWVGSAELMKYIFVELDFQRPFFITFVRSCMFSLFLLRYACTAPLTENKERTKRVSPKNVLSNPYIKLEALDETPDDASHSLQDGSEDETQDEFAEEDEELVESDYVTESLTTAEFEPLFLSSGSCSDPEEDMRRRKTKGMATSINGGGVSGSDELTLTSPEANSKSSNIREPTTEQKEAEEEGCSDGSTAAERQRRRVRFHLLREVRSLPERVARDAKLARLPYQPSYFNCGQCAPSASSPLFTYCVYFAPLWYAGSLTYQLALLFTSVSSVNLISASTSLFILVIEAVCGSRRSHRFTVTKLVLVLINIGGVAIVSQFSSSLYGSLLSLFSALLWAFYLFTFSLVSTGSGGGIDMNLMFGVVGIFSLVICTPLLWVLHFSGVEPQLPPPTQKQFLLVVLNGLVGSIFADYLWIHATMLTNSLISSLSTTLSIPLSLLADSLLRQQPPHLAQVLASIPITVSFIGATYLTSTTAHTSASRLVDKRLQKAKNSDHQLASRDGLSYELRGVKSFKRVLKHKHGSGGEDTRSETQLLVGECSDL